MKEITIDLEARRATIPVLARQLLDAPFLLYGRDPNVGLDCIAIMAISACQAGFSCPHILIRKVVNGQRWPPLLDAIRMDLEPVKKVNEIRVGDVLWFRIPGAEIDHFAIVSELNPIRMIHTNPLTLDNPSEDRLTDVMIPISFYRALGTWERWLSGAFRFAKLLDQSEGAQSLI